MCWRKQLYAELAVLPRGFLFGEPDAAVLLGGGDAATKPISVLEWWGVLIADASEKYLMHDIHVDFAKGELEGWGKIGKPAVERWTEHISSL